MKKNIIITLSVLLSFSASFSLTSCQNDDDDDPASPVLTDSRAYFSSSNLYVNYNTVDIYENTLSTSACVRNYLQTSLADVADSVKVTADFSSILIIAKAGAEQELVAKLAEMQQTCQSELSEQLSVSLPFVESLSFAIGRVSDSSNQLFSYEYNR